MAAIDRCIGAMLAAEIEYAGDKAVHQVWVPRAVLLGHIPTEDLRAYLEERERADA